MHMDRPTDVRDETYDELARCIILVVQSRSVQYDRCDPHPQCMVHVDSVRHV